MKTTKKTWAALAVLVLAFGLAGCSDGAGLDDEGGIGADAGQYGARDSHEGRFEERDPRGPEEGDRSGREEAAIGGFTIQGPGDEEISIPEAEADPAEVENYAESVRPIVDEGALDFASLVTPDEGLEGETANLGLQAEAVENALEANEEAFTELQNLETPRGLGEVQEALVDSRERAISAYDNINQAFVDDASADEVGDAIEESLPEIEYADAEARAILQELERAARSS